MKPLLLAMQMVSADLYANAWHAAGLIAFNTPGAGYGFPAPDALRDDLPPTDRTRCW